MRILKFVLLFVAIVIALCVLLLPITYYLLPSIETPVSILVLGKGGEGHTAPDLTDTIMVVNLNSNSKTTSVLSLPRDIWIPEIRAKLNTAYHYGGFKMAKDSVTTITGLPINYTVVVDFSLFKDLINSLGGIDVDVENSFIDEKYPIAGLENDLCSGDRLYICRYEILDIKSGEQNMNGELALKFVRSRNAKGDEGTDIAREKRQQKVIEAIKEKILSKDVILKPSVLKKLYDVTISHVETDIDKNSAISVVKFLFESRNNIKFLSIPEEILKISQNEKKHDRQYVFLPSSGSWTQFQEWITSRSN
jgi:LCP family protein required for cell wall assembly